MNKRIDSAGRQIKAEDRIIIIGSNNDYGTDHIATEFREKQIYGVVHSDTRHDDFWCTGNTLLVDFSRNNILVTEGHSMIQLSSDIVRIIDPEEYAKYEELAKVADNIAKEYKEGLKKFLTLEAPKQSYQDRTFRFEDKTEFDTNNSCILVGHWNKEANDFAVLDVNFQAVCCALTKVQKDLEVYIPDIWLRYFGWTVFDLVEYLKFLSKCEIGFEYEYLGIKLLSERFNYEHNSDGDFKESKYKCNFSHVPGASKIFPRTNGDFHCVRLKGSKVCDEHTYLRFICLRYLYNKEYWTIPGHAMQIKRALGAEVTHWQALLMAHLNMCYNGYYSFGNQRDINPNKPYICNNKKLGMFAFSSGNYDRHIDPFQSANDVLEGIKQNSNSVNRAFTYTCDAYKREELNKFFAEKDYVGLYNYLKEKQEIKEGSIQWLLKRTK